mgnify:CR=1 FL=1
MASISEMRRKNKEAGQHFFDRGNPSILSKQGDYLITKSFGDDGYVIYKFDKENGHINLIDNPYGEYSWQPYKNKADAIRYAKSLN